MEKEENQNQENTITETSNRNETMVNDKQESEN